MWLRGLQAKQLQAAGRAKAVPEGPDHPSRAVASKVSVRPSLGPPPPAVLPQLPLCLQRVSSPSQLRQRQRQGHLWGVEARTLQGSESQVR